MKGDDFIADEIKMSLKEFNKLLKGKNTIYCVDYKSINGIILIREVRACHESYEGSENIMTLDKLANNLNKLTSIVNNGFNQINLRLDKVEKDITILKEDVKDLKKDVALIKKCPTIQKELKNL